MGLINPDLTGAMHGDDLKPAIETILRELDGKLSTDNIEEINANRVNVYNLNANNITTGSIDASTIGVTNLDADNIIAGKLSSSDGKTYFDLDNDVIIVNDGSNDRIMIGKLS